jgi:hypothetical protein
MRANRTPNEVEIYVDGTNRLAADLIGLPAAVDQGQDFTVGFSSGLNFEVVEWAVWNTDDVTRITNIEDYTDNRYRGAITVAPSGGILHNWRADLLVDTPPVVARWSDIYNPGVSTLDWFTSNIPHRPLVDTSTHVQDSIKFDGIDDNLSLPTFLDLLHDGTGSMLVEVLTVESGDAQFTRYFATTQSGGVPGIQIFKPTTTPGDVQIIVQDGLGNLLIDHSFNTTPGVPFWIILIQKALRSPEFELYVNGGSPLVFGNFAFSPSVASSGVPVLSLAAFPTGMHLFELIIYNNPDDLLGGAIAVSNYLVARYGVGATVIPPVIAPPTPEVDTLPKAGLTDRWISDQNVQPGGGSPVTQWQPTVGASSWTPGTSPNEDLITFSPLTVIAFDGTDDTLTQPTADLFKRLHDGSGVAFGFVAHIPAADALGDTYFATMAADPDEFGFQMRKAASGVQILVANGTGTFIVDVEVSVDFDKIHAFLFVAQKDRSPTEWEIWVDGVLAASGDFDSAPSTTSPTTSGTLGSQAAAAFSAVGVFEIMSYTNPDITKIGFFEYIVDKYKVGIVPDLPRKDLLHRWLGRETTKNVPRASFPAQDLTNRWRADYGIAVNPNDPIDAWNPLAGGFDFENATPAEQPIHAVENTNLNDVPSVNHDGTNDALTAVGSASDANIKRLHNGSGASLLIAGYFPSPTGTRVVLSTAAIATEIGVRVAFDATNLTVAVYNGSGTPLFSHPTSSRPT